MSKNDADMEKLRLDLLFENGISIQDRTVLISGEIVEGDFDRLDSAMNELERGTKAGVTIRINSPGGNVYEALAMIGRLTSSKCHITTEGYGQVMSAATLLLACGDKRRISKYCTFMAHESSYSLKGTHSNIKEEVEQAERDERLWASWMAELSEEPEAFWFSVVKKKNVYLNSEQCLLMGVVDEII